MYIYPTAAGVYRICRITYMTCTIPSSCTQFGCRIHFFFTNGDLECFFPQELKILYHFTHVSILPMYLMRLTLSLCLWLQFGTRSDRLHKFCNCLTFCWYSESCFEITILEKLSRLQKACKITQHAKASTVLEVSRF